MTQHVDLRYRWTTPAIIHHSNPAAERRFYGLMIAATAGGLGLGSAAPVSRRPSSAR